MIGSRFFICPASHQMCQCNYNGFLYYTPCNCDQYRHFQLSTKINVFQAIRLSLVMHTMRVLLLATFVEYEYYPLETVFPYGNGLYVKYLTIYYYSFSNLSIETSRNSSCLLCPGILKVWDVASVPSLASTDMKDGQEIRFEQRC